MITAHKGASEPWVMRTETTQKGKKVSPWQPKTRRRRKWHPQTLLNWCDNLESLALPSRCENLKYTSQYHNISGQMTWDLGSPALEFICVSDQEKGQTKRQEGGQTMRKKQKDNELMFYIKRRDLRHLKGGRFSKHINPKHKRKCCQEGSQRNQNQKESNGQIYHHANARQTSE